jgi:hypothetical protein
MRLEGLGQLKNAIISLEIEPATFRLVALHYHVPPLSDKAMTFGLLATVTRDTGRYIFIF